MKELPATLLLRPLGVETLATHLYGEAVRGTYEDAAIAALLIVVAGLVPVILLARVDGRSGLRASGSRPSGAPGSGPGLARPEVRSPFVFSCFSWPCFRVFVALILVLRSSSGYFPAIVTHPK